MQLKYVYFMNGMIRNLISNNIPTHCKYMYLFMQKSQKLSFVVRSFV